MRKRQVIKKLQTICREKRRYKTSQQAWQAAAFYYVYYGGENVYNVYHCKQGNTKDHYHLTTHASLGDMSHIPQEYHSLFETFTQEQASLSFWQKLRRILI